MKIRLLTRKSPLALAQARLVKNALVATDPVLCVDLKPLSTQVDDDLGRSVRSFGGKGGAFTRVLEQSLLSGHGDIAVHSLKDLPATLDDGFVLAGAIGRADKVDVLVGKYSLADLPKGSIVGTSSPRRRAQLMQKRDDLNIQPIRGNLQTRLAKLVNKKVDALVLAKAGLDRLGLHPPSHPLDCLPAFGQGLIGLECRGDRDDLLHLMTKIVDQTAMREMICERACIKHLGASCLDAVAGTCLHQKDQLVLKAVVYHPVSYQKIEACGRRCLSGLTAQTAVSLGIEVAQMLLKQGAADYLGLELNE